eukprot:scaffold30187_cov58-Phaeocystis_antarctica.AAC.2
MQSAARRARTGASRSRLRGGCSTRARQWRGAAALVRRWLASVEPSAVSARSGSTSFPRDGAMRGSTASCVRCVATLRTMAEPGPISPMRRDTRRDSNASMSCVPCPQTPDSPRPPRDSCTILAGRYRRPTPTETPHRKC